MCSNMQGILYRAASIAQIKQAVTKTNWTQMVKMFTVIIGTSHTQGSFKCSKDIKISSWYLQLRGIETTAFANVKTHGASFTKKIN